MFADLTQAMLRERTARLALTELVPGDVSRKRLWLVMR